MAKGIRFKTEDVAKELGLHQKPKGIIMDDGLMTGVALFIVASFMVAQAGNFLAQVFGSLLFLIALFVVFRCLN